MYKHHQSMACLLAQMSSSMPFISTSYFNHLKVSILLMFLIIFNKTFVFWYSIVIIII